MDSTDLIVAKNDNNNPRFNKTIVKFSDKILDAYQLMGYETRLGLASVSHFFNSDPSELLEFLFKGEYPQELKSLGFTGEVIFRLEEGEDDFVPTISNQDFSLLLVYLAAENKDKKKMKLSKLLTNTNK